MQNSVARPCNTAATPCRKVYSNARGMPTQAQDAIPVSTDTVLLQKCGISKPSVQNDAEDSIMVASDESSSPYSCDCAPFQLPDPSSETYLDIAIISLAEARSRPDSRMAGVAIMSPTFQDQESSPLPA